MVRAVFLCPLARLCFSVSLHKNKNKMSTTVDRIQLEIAVKHDKTRQEIAQVTDSITAETDALKKMKDDKFNEAYEEFSRKYSIDFWTE